MERKRPPIMWDIVEQHFDEAAFLLSQWRRALDSPRVTPSEVATGPEERLLRHIQALTLCPTDAFARFVQESDPRDWEAKVLVSMLVLLEDRERRKALYTILEPMRKEPATPRLYAEALGLSRGPRIESVLGRLLSARDRRFQLASLDAMAMRGCAAGPLQPFLTSRKPVIRAAALRAARYGPAEVRAQIERGYDWPKAAVRDAALEAGLVQGLRSAYLAARRAVEKRDEELGFPLLVLALSGDPADLDLLAACLEAPATRSAALWALGFSGWPRAAELCLTYLEDEELGRRAGEAFSAITGLEIEEAYAISPEPPSGADDTILEGDQEATAEELLPGPDAELPDPDAEEIEAWWADEQARFESGKRYLGGKPWKPEVVLERLRSGPMRRRRPLALELAVRSRGAFQISTQTWARDQLRRLSEQKLEVRSGFEAPFSRLLQA